MELLLLHHGFFDLLFFFIFFFLHTYMHNTIQYTQLVLDSYPFSSLYKILSKSLDVCNNNNHKQAPPLLIRSSNQKRAQMRKPFKERQQFWWLFLFWVFRQPITNLVSPGSKCRSSSAALICIPVCRDQIPRRYSDGHDEFQNSETRGGLAAHER